MNERPIFLRCHFLLFGAVEAFLHLYRDQDQTPLPLPSPCDAEPQYTWELAPFDRVRANVLPIFSDTGKHVLAMFVVSMIAYVVILRSFAWSWSLWHNARVSLETLQRCILRLRGSGAPEKWKTFDRRFEGPERQPPDRAQI